jgi:hypothetical protein
MKMDRTGHVGGDEVGLPSDGLDIAEGDGDQEVAAADTFAERREIAAPRRPQHVALVDPVVTERLPTVRDRPQAQPVKRIVVAKRSHHGRNPTREFSFRH